MTIYTALVTPFLEDDSLDIPGLEQLLIRQQQASVDGLVLLGTTAETPTLSLDEKKTILSLTRSISLPKMVGCGSNCTKTTLKLIELAASFGAEQALVVSPYYNRPPPESLLTHFTYIAQHSPLPIVLYNHPGRTGVYLSPSLIEELSLLPNIVGIKEVTGNFIETVMRLKQSRPTFKIYAGDDPLILTARAYGAEGLISVASNIIPQQMKALFDSHWPDAQVLMKRLWPLFEALSLTTNPMPIKAALSILDLPAGAPRLPLTPLDEKEKDALRAILCKWPF